MSIEKIHLIRTRSRDLLACSIVPQANMLQRATTNIDDLTGITYTSYSIYSNKVLLQWCEVNGPLLDHIQVVGFLDGPCCIQNHWCSTSRTATSFLPLSHNCTKISTNYINLVNCNSMKKSFILSAYIWQFSVRINIIISCPCTELSIMPWRHNGAVEV
jgi:hypothetical protein